MNTLAAHANKHTIYHPEQKAFRMRMMEQLCHIENYRQQVLNTEGRVLNPEEAASEWIDHHAAAFPALSTSAMHSPGFLTAA